MSSSSQRPSWSSIIPEMKLPPISETSSGSQTSTSPRSSKTWKARENENPFRRNSRRISVSSTSSSLSTSSEPMATLRPPSLSLKQRRTSFDQKKRCVSIDLSTSEEIIRKLQERRKSSVLNIMPDGRRASFGSIGARITTILKAKKAFSLLAKKRKAANDDTEEQDKEYEIEELPPSPRFASTLSAEAQYAVMKGYEDIVHTYLCRQFPEYRPMLRRNQTPHTGIIVKAMKEKFENKFASDERKASDDNADDNSVDTVDAGGPVSASTPKPDTNFDCYLQHTFDPSPIPDLSQSKRSTHVAFPRRTISSISSGSDMKTSPEVAQSKESQLVMTYRYHRVMDILDNLREHQGFQALSPRKRDDCHIEPLKDFNSWSRVWTREFEPKTCMKTL